MVTHINSTLKLSELGAATLPLSDDVFIIGLQVDSEGNTTDVKMARRDILSGKTQNWLGAWDETVDYVPYDCVSYGGSSYIATDINTDSRPDLDTAVWNLFAQRGSQGVDGNLSEDSIATINDAISQVNTAVNNSQGNASAAGTSATTATNAANTASQHAQEGATYANQSQTNANAAASSATSAAASALNSASGANSVASSMKEFRRLFLGSFASDPQTDGNGEALVAGAVYLNTDTNKLRTYSDSGWADYDQSVQDVQAAASNSASAASSSESNASISATNASNAATQAASHASDAGTSATTATQAATQASAASTTAATSANQAATSATTVTGVAGRFLGISATAPTTRLDGTALVVGDLYQDKGVPPNSFIYTTSGWLAIVAVNDLLTAKYKADFTSAVSRVSSWKLYESTSIFDITATNKPGDTWDATTSLTSANSLTGRTIVIPRGIHKVTANITLTGVFRFEDGAILQPAAGVTITFNKAKIEANVYSKIFDSSLGGLITGSIRGKTYSICWWGADPANVTASGTQINQALAAKLTPICYVPYGFYDHTGVVLQVNSIALVGDQNAVPTFVCKTDQGANAIAAEFKFVSAMEDIIWYGPSTNSTIAYGSVGVLMDGPVLGGLAGVASQTKFKRVTFTGYRYGTVFNETNGHVWFDTCHWTGNYASICALQTGSDYTFIDCDSGSERLATFYIPRNGSMGTNWNIRGNFYYRLMPWFVVQDTVDDTRSPYTAGVTRPIIAGVQEWQAVNGEQIGNGFMNLLPTDSYFGGVRLKDSGWASGNTAYQAKSGNFTRTDYSWCVGLMSYVTAISNGQGVNFWTPGTVGIVYTYSGSTSISFYDFQAPSSMTGKVYSSGIGYKYIRPLLYTPPFINVPAGTTSITYTMTQQEAETMASTYGMLASMVPRNNQTGYVPAYRFIVSGATLTITFQTATTAQFYGTLDLLRRPG